MASHLKYWHSADLNGILDNLLIETANRRQSSKLNRFYLHQSFREKITIGFIANRTVLN